MCGGDKARIRIGGTSILERVLARLRPQCARLILNVGSICWGLGAFFVIFGSTESNALPTGGRRSARRHGKRRMPSKHYGAIGRIRIGLHLWLRHLTL
jgi:molybdopterin-guanine dinucleotide biosynthesis protein A